ncbi:hypothetical protein Hanom_Chr16g01514051 [Helianthus anomalus]
MASKHTTFSHHLHPTAIQSLGSLALTTHDKSNDLRLLVIYILYTLGLLHANARQWVCVGSSSLRTS